MAGPGTYLFLVPPSLHEGIGEEKKGSEEREKKEIRYALTIPSFPEGRDKEREKKGKTIRKK